MDLMGHHGTTDGDVERWQQEQRGHHGTNFCLGKGCEELRGIDGVVHGIDGVVHAIDGVVHAIDGVVHRIVLQALVQVGKEVQWWDMLVHHNLATQHKYKRVNIVLI